MEKNNNIEAFFALLRSGLWEKEVQLLPYGEVDFSTVLDLAEEQSVVGLLAAGIEHVVDGKPQKKDVLQFIGRTVQLEQKNQAMNYFIGVTVEKMREAGIYTLLVKGQGVAQCYEGPLWRAFGDVDFFLSDDNYEKAKAFLSPLASEVESEYKGSKHLGMTIDPWVVELHGSLRMGLPRRINDVLDEIKSETLSGGNVRTWDNDGTQLFMLGKENDAVYVFAHFFNHFYKGGLGLRQICDWCRLLWTYRNEIDVQKIEERIKRMGLVSEWKAFAALAVNDLGMPAEAMPFYDSRFKVKDSRLVEFILGGYLGNKVKDTWQIAKIFPRKAMHYAPSIFLNVNWLKVKERMLKR